MDIFHNFFYVPIFNLLMFLYQLLNGNLGLAILGVALIAKIITYPLTRRQIKSAGKNKEFQSRSKEIKNKYKDDQERLAKEMAKIQAEYLPAQLGGCLNLILVIVLLIQVRNVVINLVHEGAHAFNEVAYAETLQLPEDSLKYELPEDIDYGLHTVRYIVTSSAGSKLDKEIQFGLAENDDQKQELEKQIADSNSDLSEDEIAERDKMALEERRSNIAVTVSELKGDKVLNGKDYDLSAFLRAPSNQTINYNATFVELDGNRIDKNELTTTQGEALNFEFIGADLSKVATDIGFDDAKAVAPYVAIAISVGIAQFFSSRIQSGMTTMSSSDDDEKKSKKSKKKGKDEKDEPDFAEMMQNSTKSMMFVFPFITILMSLGFLGGATFFPTGVSVFWTGQSTFVIIEQIISNRSSVFTKLKTRFNGKEKE